MNKNRFRLNHDKDLYWVFTVCKNSDGWIQGHDIVPANSPEQAMTKHLDAAPVGQEWIPVYSTQLHPFLEQMAELETENTPEMPDIKQYFAVIYDREINGRLGIPVQAGSIDEARQEVLRWIRAQSSISPDADPDRLDVAAVIDSDDLAQVLFDLLAKFKNGMKLHNN